MKTTKKKKPGKVKPQVPPPPKRKVVGNIIMEEQNGDWVTVERSVPKIRKPSSLEDVTDAIIKASDYWGLHPVDLADLRPFKENRDVYSKLFIKPKHLTQGNLRAAEAKAQENRNQLFRAWEEENLKGGSPLVIVRGHQVLDPELNPSHPINGKQRKELEEAYKRFGIKATPAELPTPNGTGKAPRGRGKDRWGYREGSRAAAINSVLTSTPLSGRQIGERIGLVSNPYGHLRALLEKGLIERTKDGLFFVPDDSSGSSLGGRAMSTLKVKLSDAKRLLVRHGFRVADTWNLKKCQGRIERLEDEEVDFGGDKDLQKLNESILDAIKHKATVTVVEDEEEEEEKPAAKKGAKPAAKKGKKEEPEEEEEEDEDEDEEEEPEEDEEEEDAEEEDSEEEESDDDEEEESDDEDEEEEEERPVKKVSTKKGKKPEKPSKPDKKKPAKERTADAVGKDKFGCRLGTQAAAINAAVGKKGKTVGDIVDEVGNGISRARVKSHLNWMVGTGTAIVKDDKYSLVSAK